MEGFQEFWGQEREGFCCKWGCVLPCVRRGWQSWFCEYENGENTKQILEGFDEGRWWLGLACGLKAVTFWKHSMVEPSKLAWVWTPRRDHRKTKLRMWNSHRPKQLERWCFQLLQCEDCEMNSMGEEKNRIDYDGLNEQNLTTSKRGCPCFRK